MENHRIKMKIGAAEFEAEGPPEVVAKQFEAFMAAVTAAPKDTPAAPAAANPPSVSSALGNSDGTPKVANGATAGLTQISAAVMQQIFKRGDTLSMMALPHTDKRDADALIALMYAYDELEGEKNVTGTSLMKSAKMSGVNVERIDRVIATYIPELVMAGGVKKARRYSLNNRGRLQAEAIIRGIVE